MTRGDGVAADSGAPSPALSAPARGVTPVLILLTGLAAAVFVAWPGFTVDRTGDWRSVLAGFQLQRETGDFIGATRSLIHFHGLDGRRGRLHFLLAPRIEGDRARVEVAGPSGIERVTLGNQPTEVTVDLDGTSDLEVRLEATEASNPRPIRLSGVRVERDTTAGSVVLALLPLLIGGLAFVALSGREPWRGAIAASVLVIAASSYFVVAALDPVRANTFARGPSALLPIALALAFAVSGLLNRSSFSAALALMGVIVSLHLDTVHGGFVYDDRLWARPWTLGELASTFAGSEDPRGISGEQYRPIPSLTHALDHALWGSSSFAFHGTNMALHGVSAFLLFLLLERLRLPRGPALLGALVLAVHPMAASSIGWISERTDTLTDLFMLATLYLFLGPGGTRVLSVLGLALLALWSKETAVMLPVLALLLALIALDAEARRARFATLRALFGLVVLFVAVWVSLFPEKTVGRLQATAATLQSDQSGWMPLFGSLFSQLVDPLGFETWRASREAVPNALWVGLVLLVGIGSVIASLFDRPRALAWRLIPTGLAVSALVVLPFRGHDAVDIYRLGHSPTMGFALLVAGLGTLLCGDSRWRSLALAALILLRYGPVARETSAAWGYPGFQFRMALRFNLENPTFLGGLTGDMRRDLERERRFEAHRDDPIRVPFEP